MNNNENTNFEQYEKDNRLLIEDLLICPECNSIHCIYYSKCEIDLSYDYPATLEMKCRCLDCKNTFNVTTNFEYQLISSKILNRKTKDIF